MPRRLYRRVHLRLPVRLRWTAPLGQKVEQCETRNASRGGLLLACHEHHGVGMPLWVTFPYDPARPDGQPEILARVLRCEDDEGGNRISVAIHFEGSLNTAPYAPAAGAGKSDEPPGSVSSRSPLSVPIRVRPERVPWFEEAMTIDVASDTLRFVTNRVYSPGDTLRVSFLNAESIPWRGAAEQPARVVSIEQLPDGPSLAVTLRRLLSS